MAYGMSGTNSYFARSNAALNFGTTNIVTSATNFDTNGAFRCDGSRRIGDLADGTSKTPLACEVLAGRADIYSHSGGDKQADFRGAWALYAVGSAVYMHTRTPNSNVGDSMVMGLRKQCSPAPRMPCTAQTDNKLQNAAARSAHTRGVNTVFADGHVQFIQDGVDLAVWQAIGTIDGEESVDITLE